MARVTDSRSKVRAHSVPTPDEIGFQFRECSRFRNADWSREGRRPSETRSGAASRSDP